MIIKINIIIINIINKKIKFISLIKNIEIIQIKKINIQLYIIKIINNHNFIQIMILYLIDIYHLYLQIIILASRYNLKI